MAVPPLALGLLIGANAALLWFSARCVWRQVRLQELVLALWAQTPEWVRERTPPQVVRDVAACARLNGVEVR